MECKVCSESSWYGLSAEMWPHQLYSSTCWLSFLTKMETKWQYKEYSEKQKLLSTGVSLQGKPPKIVHKNLLLHFDIFRLWSLEKSILKCFNIKSFNIFHDFLETKYVSWYFSYCISKCALCLFNWKLISCHALAMRLCTSNILRLLIFHIVVFLTRGTRENICSPTSIYFRNSANCTHRQFPNVGVCQVQ